MLYKRTAILVGGAALLLAGGMAAALHVPKPTLHVSNSYHIKTSLEAKEAPDWEEPEWKEFKLTAYTAFCPSGCTGVTRTGLDVTGRNYHNGRRIVAVDPAVIPLHSNLRIKLWDGRIIKAVAEDTGGAIDGRHIDLLVDSTAEANRIGVRAVEVEVLGR